MGTRDIEFYYRKFVGLVRDVDVAEAELSWLLITSVYQAPEMVNPNIHIHRTDTRVVSIFLSYCLPK